MPMYDYRCAKCNHMERDKFRSAEHYKDPIHCPKCGTAMGLALASPTKERSFPRTRVANVFRKV